MPYEQIGPIEIVTGENNSKVPYSTSLLLNGHKTSALIDCGGGKSAFQYFKTHKTIDEIYLTHYHLDHIWGAHLFPDATVYINPYDYDKITDPHELAKASGIQTVLGKKRANEWVHKQLNRPAADGDPAPSWKRSWGVADRIYPYNETIKVADMDMVIIHTPGHSEGYCCPYFPEYGVLYAGDFDLTSFGPWYNNADSDIDQFFASAQRTLETDAKYFVTGHHKGTFERAEYVRRLERYMDIIHTREEKTKTAIQRGVPPQDIIYREIFYYVKNHRERRSYMISEIIGIAKHIERLIAQGYPFEAYFEDFISHFRLERKLLNYKSEPARAGSHLE